jgi:ornithine carbamoyltransferase
MYDGMEYRGFDQQTVEELGRDVPVWNGLTNEFRPTQVLADLLTMMEHSDKPLHDILPFATWETAVTTWATLRALRVRRGQCPWAW